MYVICVTFPYSDAFSAYSAPNPHVMAQTYIAPGAIHSMSVTNTGQGVTTREVLLGYVHGQIQAVSKRLLDPRRPYKTASAMSAEEKEELLVPYSAVLEENPKEVITHELQVQVYFRIFGFV
jgi:hypothetical protein